jgi:YbbR domain-containing protein
VPIEFRNLPKSFELMSVSDDRAEVQVAGSRRLILQLKPEEISLWLNLANTRSGKNSYALTRNNISVPPGFNVIKINPHEITVVMEERETRIVEVIPQWEGTLPENKKLVSFRLTPDRVAVFGAPSVLKAITTIKTEPIDLSGVEKSDTIEAAIILPTASVSLAPESPPRIRVEREIVDTAQQPEKKKQKSGKAR